MISIFRRLFAIVLVVGAVAPAAAAVCLPADAQHCTRSSAHDCCEGPRVSGCDCKVSHGGPTPAEPAQRNVVPAAHLIAAGVVANAGVVIPAMPVLAVADSSPPALSVTDRLSLFSTLLV